MCRRLTCGLDGGPSKAVVVRDLIFTSPLPTGETKTTEKNYKKTPYGRDCRVLVGWLDVFESGVRVKNR